MYFLFGSCCPICIVSKQFQLVVALSVLVGSATQAPGCLGSECGVRVSQHEGNSRHVARCPGGPGRTLST